MGDCDTIDRLSRRVTELKAENCRLDTENDHLKERHQAHLELIVRLSKDSITTGEAEEMRGQIAKLIAEVGTLRARIDQQ